MTEQSLASTAWAKQLKQWVLADTEKPAAPTTMAEMRTVVTNAVMEPTSDSLAELNHLLSPLAAHLSQQLVRKGTDLKTLQSAEVPVWSAMVRIARDHITWVDPEKSLALIRHGEQVLQLLMFDEKGSHNPGDGKDLCLKDWSKHIATQTGKGLSTSTLSRVLKGLEQAGFIQLFGATRGRRCVFLAKACAWEKKKWEEKNRVKSAASSQSTSSPSSSLPTNMTTSTSIKNHPVRKVKNDDSFFDIIDKIDSFRKAA